MNLSNENLTTKEDDTEDELTEKTDESSIDGLYEELCKEFYKKAYDKVLDSLDMFSIIQNLLLILIELNDNISTVDISKSLHNSIDSIVRISRMEIKRLKLFEEEIVQNYSSIFDEDITEIE